MFYSQCRLKSHQCLIKKNKALVPFSSENDTEPTCLIVTKWPQTSTSVDDTKLITVIALYNHRLLCHLPYNKIVIQVM